MAKRKNRDAEAPAKLGRKEFEAELYKLDAPANQMLESSIVIRSYFASWSMR